MKSWTSLVQILNAMSDSLDKEEAWKVCQSVRGKKKKNALYDMRLLLNTLITFNQIMSTNQIKSNASIQVVFIMC